MRPWLNPRLEQRARRRRSSPRNGLDERAGSRGLPALRASGQPLCALCLRALRMATPLPHTESTEARSSQRQFRNRIQVDLAAPIGPPPSTPETAANGFAPDFRTSMVVSRKALEPWILSGSLKAWNFRFLAGSKAFGRAIPRLTRSGTRCRLWPAFLG